MPSDCEPTVLKESNITESLLNQAATFSKYYRATMSYPASNDSYAYLEFNASPRSWGYSYVAHRFKKNSKHQFVISILSANKGTWKGERTFTCVGIFRCTEFQIQCKRRAQCDSDQNIRFFSKDAKLLEVFYMNLYSTVSTVGLFTLYCKILTTNTIANPIYIIELN